MSCSCRQEIRHHVWTKCRQNRRISPRFHRLLRIFFSTLCCLLVAVILLHLASMLSRAFYVTRCRSIVDLDAVLEYQRRSIAVDMEAANYSSDWSTQYLLEAEGEPIRNVIVTTWRSGSTFFNDLLNTQPGNFDHYEPFHPLGFVNIDLDTDYYPSEDFKKIINCDYSSFSRPLFDTVLFNVNKHLLGLLPHNCYYRELIEPICKLFPSQSMKLIRVRLRHLVSVMRKYKNMRVFYLVRDPRATMSSRHGVDWCTTSTCNDSASLCTDLLDDFRAAITLAVHFPTRFRAVRFEDLAEEPTTFARNLFQEMKLVFDSRVEAFLKANTRRHEGGLYSVRRNSSVARFMWREKMDYEEVEAVQSVCKMAMDSWGYLPVTSEEELRSFMPVRRWSLYAEN